jgi:hypothetical protein
MNFAVTINKNEKLILLVYGNETIGGFEWYSILIFKHFLELARPFKI